MDWSLLFAAIGLMLVFEGILPFICPDCWRRTMLNAAQQDNRALRVIGLSSMVIGVLFVIFS